MNVCVGGGIKTHVVGSDGSGIIWEVVLQLKMQCQSHCDSLWTPSVVMFAFCRGIFFRQVVGGSGQPLPGSSRALY